MRPRFFLIPLLITAALAACDSISSRGPAPVLNLGLHSDSKTGAIIVSAQDNVYAIAQRYRLPLRDIIDINGLQPPYRLADNQRLLLPAPMEYRVRDGDTPQGISTIFGVSASQLMAVNNIAPPYRLAPGVVLRLPSAHLAASAGQVQSRPEPSGTNTPVRWKGKRGTPSAPATVEARAMPAPLSRGVLAAGPASPPGRFIWPVRGRVISGYGPKGDGLYNDGINIAALRGAPVTAAADGVVAYAGGDLKSYGNLVLIRHKGGVMTAYAHLDTVMARKGMVIRRGQQIGTVGSTGSVESSQLHFEIRQGTKTCDPQRYLG